MLAFTCISKPEAQLSIHKCGTRGCTCTTKETKKHGIAVNIVSKGLFLVGELINSTLVLPVGPRTCLHVCVAIATGYPVARLGFRRQTCLCHFLIALSQSSDTWTRGCNVSWYSNGMYMYVIVTSWQVGCIFDTPDLPWCSWLVSYG